MDHDLIGNAAAAAHVGLRENTWSSYVNTGHAPKPYRREQQGGYARPVWRQSDLDAWQAARPGRGVGGGRKPKPRVD